MLPTEQKPALPRSSVVMDGKKRQTSGKCEGADKAGDLQSRAVIAGALAPTADAVRQTFPFIRFCISCPQEQNKLSVCFFFRRICSLPRGQIKIVPSLAVLRNPSEERVGTGALCPFVSSKHCTHNGDEQTADCSNKSSKSLL